MNENTLDFTILTKMEVSEYGYDYNVTDFSILLGSQDEGYWTNDRCGYGVGLKGTTAIGIDANRRRVGARPALPYSSISTFVSNSIMVKSGMFEVEYGEYPQTVVSEDIAKNLEELYTNGTIKQTGKSYTTDSHGDSWTESPFEAQTFPEYEYNGKKYIRVKGQNMFSVVQRDRYFSDGRKMCVGEIYWVEVEPIKWLINEKTNMALSKNVIFAGVQYDDTKYYNYNFKQTAIKKFMDRYFSKEIIPGMIKKEDIDNEINESDEIKETKDVSNDSIIEAYHNVEKRISSINSLLNEVNENITIYETGILLGSSALSGGINIDGLNEDFVENMKKSLNGLKISKNSLEQQLNLSKKEKMLYDNILKGKIDKFKFNLELLKIRTNFDLLKLNTEISVLSEQTSNSKKR